MGNFVSIKDCNEILEWFYGSNLVLRDTLVNKLQQTNWTVIKMMGLSG